MFSKLTLKRDMFDAQVIFFSETTNNKKHGY